MAKAVSNEESPRPKTPAEEHVEFVENRVGHRLTESEKRFAIRQAELCAELLPFLEEIKKRLPERTPEELAFLRDMERLEGRPLEKWEANLYIAQARLIGHLP